MAELIGKIPEGKLKLLEKALGNLAVVAKNSGPLNELFETMKEGSMITAPYQTFLDVLKAESTRASADSIKELFALLKDPATKDAIDLLAAGVSGVMTVIADLTTGFAEFLIPADDVKTWFNDFWNVVKAWYENPLGQIVSFINDLNAVFSAGSTTAWLAEKYGGGTADPDPQSGRGGHQEW